MNIKLHNMFRFLTAEANLKEGVNFVTGENSAGKTSFATCVAAMSAFSSNPLGVSASHQKRYVRDGELDGVAVMRDGDWVVQWEPPNQVTRSGLTEPLATPHAVGLHDFIAPMNQKARSAMWESLFVPDNPRDILEQAWPDEYISQLPIVITQIERHGWDNALKLYTDQRRDAKARWEHITGKRYGLKVAMSWVPPYYTTALAPKSLETLKETHQNALDALRALESSDSVKQELIDMAAEAKEKVSSLQKQQKDCENEIREIRDHYEAMEQTPEYKESRNAYEKAQDELLLLEDKVEADKRTVENFEKGTPQEVTCPECGATFMTPACGPSKEVLAEMAVRVEEAKKQGEKVRKLRKKHQKKYDRRFGNVAQARYDLGQKLLGLQEEERVQQRIVDEYGNKTLRQATDEDIEKARMQVNSAAEEVKAKKRYDDAMIEHEEVQRLDTICQILGPSGARTLLMAKRMEQVRKSLASVIKATEWLPIEMLEDYNITSGGRPIQLCAENEKLKAQWAVQIAVALVVKSKVIVIDNADTLRGSHWTGLISMVEKLTEKFTDIYVVICATEHHDGVPDNWHVIDLAAV